MGLREAIADIGKKIEDLTELEIVTYTGKANVLIVKDDGSIDWSQLKKGSTTNAALKIVAATQLKLDGDSYTFHTEDEIPRMAELLELHQQSIQNGLQTRKALTDFFSDNIKALAR